ncbi:MAG: hydrogenase expression/formation protein HypE [Planctomycetaceae bacterium]|nr:hydrogenase expression/formation protein HypE [Planctomycetaceae bacterium]
MEPAASWHCPTNFDSEPDRVTLAHGEGGRGSREFLRQHILKRFPQVANSMSDAACLTTHQSHLAFTTDSFVVAPLFFPGGDIGKLAVIGTANDLAVSGAKPMWLSLSLIIEEGFSVTVLERILDSIAATAAEVDMTIVTGDTKVVPRGCVDGLFINTSGIGVLLPEHVKHARSLIPGDVILVSGPIGQHGFAVLASREKFEMQSELTSDCGLLWPAVAALHAANIPTKTIRDATRGGMAAVLHEWADACGHSLCIDQNQIPVTSEVRGLSELLGIDPLFVANEGTMLVAVPASVADMALEVLRAVPISRHSQRIGVVEPRQIVPVSVIRTLKRRIPLDEPLGAMLPRIC